MSVKLDINVDNFMVNKSINILYKMVKLKYIYIYYRYIGTLYIILHSVERIIYMI